eukprot:725048-Pyramimonas_sp.AAC.1
MCGGDWDDEDVVETYVPAGTPDEVGDANMSTAPHRVWPRQTPRLHAGFDWFRAAGGRGGTLAAWER